MMEYYLSKQSIANWEPYPQVIGDFTQAAELLVFIPPPIRPEFGRDPNPDEIESGELIKLNFNNNSPLPLHLSIQGSMEGLSEFWKGWSKSQRDWAFKEAFSMLPSDPQPLRLGLYNIRYLDKIADGSLSYLSAYVPGEDTRMSWGPRILASSGTRITVDLKVLALQYWRIFQSLFYSYDKEEVGYDRLNFKSFRFLYDDISSACKAGTVIFEFPDITETNSGAEEVGRHNRSSLASIIREQGTSWPTINNNGKRNTSSGSSFRN